MSFLSFGKKPSPKEQCQQWCSQLKGEQRTIMRDIRKVEREQQKLKIELKKMAKKPAISKNALRTLAKSLVRSQNTVARLHAQHAQVNSVVLQIKEHMGTLKVAKTMQISTGVMASMNRLISVPQLNMLARNMSREMSKAGLMQEMMEETFEDLDDEDVEEEAEAEVERTLYELTDGQFGSIPEADRKLVAPEPEEEPQVDEAEKRELAAMQQRLAALTS